MSLKTWIKCLSCLAAVASAVSFVGVRWTQAQRQLLETAGQRFKSIKVLNDMPADQMGKVMNMFSSSLGVDCKFCHASNDGDYEKEGNENKDIARRMIKMVFDLNKTQFEGRPEINCNTCHNGQSHPRPSFPLGLPRKAEPRPAQPEKRPSPADILDKYESAIGGRPALNRLGDREVRSVRLEPDGKTTEPEKIYLKDNGYAADLWYGEYVVREVFDGTAARKFGGGSMIELKPDEAEQIRREALIFWPATFRSVYPKVEYRSVDRIDGREAYVVSATTGTGVTERLWFDKTDGLLIRRTASTPTIFGGFVYQVDYSEYRAFSGVKLPTVIKYAVPHITWTRKILDVSSASLDDRIFEAPKKA